MSCRFDNASDDEDPGSGHVHLARAGFLTFIICKLEELDAKIS
jgi:hypothetical protein